MRDDRQLPPTFLTTAARVYFGYRSSVPFSRRYA